MTTTIEKQTRRTGFNTMPRAFVRELNRIGGQTTAERAGSEGMRERVKKYWHEVNAGKVPKPDTAPRSTALYCPRGHYKGGANVYLHKHSNGNTYAQCRECRSENARKSDAKIKTN